MSRRARKRKCLECGKVIRTESDAARVALDVRTGVRRLSGIRAGYGRTHAYACPHGRGWHVGRAPRNGRGRDA